MIIFRAHLEGNTLSYKYISSAWCKAYFVNILLISRMKRRLWLSKCWKCVNLMLNTRLAIYIYMSMERYTVVQESSAFL